MAKEKKSLEEQLEEYRQWREVSPPMNWRAWGSWFSWGSPVGLGLFFVSLAITFWIVMQAV